MKITNQQRDKAYEVATPQQLFLYEDPESGGSLSNIAHNHTLKTRQTYADFAIAIGDVILGLVPQEQLPQLLIERLGVAQAQAMRITADVLDFLEPLNTGVLPNAITDGPAPETNPAIPVAINPQAQPAVAPATPDTTQTPTITPPAYNTVAQNDALAQEIAQAEAQFHELQPIRTMAHDMDTLKQVTEGEGETHQAASQEELLTKKTPEANQTDGRWGT